MNIIEALILLLILLVFLGWKGLIAFPFMLLFFWFLDYLEKIGKVSPMEADKCVLKFQGIPVTGPIEKFKEELIKQGWTYRKSPDEESFVWMQGKFLDDQDATIKIYFTRTTRCVKSVYVCLGPYDQDSLNMRYNSICELIGKEYTGGKTVSQHTSKYYKYSIQVVSDPRGMLEVSYRNTQNEAADLCESD